MEAGESSREAAYRELQEGTGITHQDICLFHLMDITYYYQDFILELYVGQLHKEIKLIEEINPLEWLSLSEDFSNSGRFAGEQNIAHIVNVAMKHPLDERTKDIKIDYTRKSIGVDGCRGGWIAAVINEGKLSIEKYDSIKSLTYQHSTFEECIVDMVIGLPSSNLYIRPDTEARKLLPGRTSTIFAVPSRQAVYADTEQEQIEDNINALGKSLAKQTMAIIPKMREVDEFLLENVKYINVIKESHPEVCFARLNGSVVMTRKAETEGMTERVKILKRYLSELEDSYILLKAKEFRCNADDIVDAICLAVAANLNVQGFGESIPAKPMKDDMGLLMQMIIPHRDVTK